MKPVRFHFVYTFRTLKYGLPLLLIPMVRLIFQFDWENFLIAVTQNIFILSVITIYSILKWIFTSCKWNPQTLTIHKGILIKQNIHYNSKKIAVIEFKRPLYYRILGASIVYIYFKSNSYPKKCIVYLKKKDAIAFRNSVFSNTNTESAVYKLSGWKRLAFILLSGDVISTMLFGFLGWRQLMQILGEDKYILQQIALTGVLTIEQFIGLLLPTGATLLITLLFLTALLTVVRSFFQTANYSVARHHSFLVVTFGLIERIERYTDLHSINTCDIRHTPFSRLIRYYPVHITAGGYRRKALPLLICKNSEQDIIKALIPQWHSSKELSLVNQAHKSFPTYIWLSGSLFAFFLLMYIVAQSVLPSLLPLLFIPCSLTALSFFVHVEAFFFEGIAKHPLGGISLCYSKFFTRHHVLVFTNNCSFILKENVLGIFFERCNFYIRTPANERLRVRGISSFIGRNIQI